MHIIYIKFTATVAYNSKFPQFPLLSPRMSLLPRNLGVIYLAAWLRSFGIGLLGVVLGVFLYREGFSSTVIGLVIAAGLAGAATATVFVTFKAERLGRRHTLTVLSLLAAVGAIPLIFSF